jgi:hypothetical protein
LRHPFTGAFFYAGPATNVPLLTECLQLRFAPYFYSMSSDTGKWVMIIGILVVLAGVVIYFFHDKMNWIGRLPGDIRIEKENFKFYFPITTMIIFSLLLTLIIQLIKKFLH